MSEGNGAATQEQQNVGVCSLCGAMVHPRLAQRHTLMHQNQGWTEQTALASEALHAVVQEQARRAMVAQARQVVAEADAGEETLDAAEE